MAVSQNYALMLIQPISWNEFLMALIDKWLDLYNEGGYF